MSPYALAILAVIASRPVYREDVSVPEEKRAQLEIIAPAIAKASRGDKFVAALLIAIGDAETHWSLRIWRGLCNYDKHECDDGRARGLTQNHRTSFITDTQWAAMATPTPEGTLASMTVSASLLQYGVRMCGRKPECVLSVFAGVRPGKQWRGLDVRMHTFNQAIGRI